MQWVKAEVTAQTPTTSIVSYHSEVPHPTTSTWKNSYWIMKTHLRRKLGRGRLLRIHSKHLKVSRRTEGLIQLPTWINRIPSRVIRQLALKSAIATLQKSLCWELPIDSKIALVPLVVPPLSTRSVLVIRKSRVFKNSWQRACLPRNEDLPIPLLFKRLRRRNSDFPDSLRAKGEAIRCKKIVRIIAF
jgi:hypothetical protein